jgi:hypothetical protein
MSKSITVEIVVRKTYQQEVDDDFDFENEAAVQEYLENLDNDGTPDTEDWESAEITDDDEGTNYQF